MTTNIVRGNVMSIECVDITWDPAAVATITTAEQDVTVPGVLPGDIILSWIKPTNTTGAMPVNARVKSADTVSVTFVNPTAGSVNPASETWKFVIGRVSGTCPSIFNP